MLLLTDLPDHEGALQGVADRVELALSTPYFLDAGAVSVGCSIGIVPGDRDLTALELLARADDAMHRQKSQKGALRQP